MPIYEYRCNHCQEKFSQLIRNTTRATTVTCDRCQSANVSKLISTFAVHQSEGSRLDNLDLNKPQNDDFYKDRQNIGLWAKKQMQRRGIKPNSQFEEVVDKARTGKFLEE